MLQGLEVCLIWLLFACMTAFWWKVQRRSPVGEEGHSQKLLRKVAQQQMRQAGAASSRWADQHKHLRRSCSRCVCQSGTDKQCVTTQGGLQD